MNIGNTIKFDDIIALAKMYRLSERTRVYKSKKTTTKF